MSGSYSRFLTLEREALLLLLSALGWMAATVWAVFTSPGQLVHVSLWAFIFAWLVWFLAWASKGGIPPSIVR